MGSLVIACIADFPFESRAAWLDASAAIRFAVCFSLPAPRTAAFGRRVRGLPTFRAIALPGD
jgi:hypothetical protein